MLPDKIQEFLVQNHVVSLAIKDDEGLWAASCFYALDTAQARLIVLTSQTTRHGQQMLIQPRLAGTVAQQPQHLREIRGLQFTAHAELLDGIPRQDALGIYTRRHPLAMLKRTDVWAIRLDGVKYTDNHYVFAQKMCWERPSAECAPLQSPIGNDGQLR